MGIRDRWNKAREEFEAQEQEKKAQKASEDPYHEQCGNLVVEDTFAAKRVAIYQNGYVRIGMFKLGAPEKLMGISATDGSSNKTGVGRGAAAVATGGLNYLLSESKRGDLYLTIITDKKTHSLHTSVPDDSEVRSMLKLEAAGSAVLKAPTSSADAPSGSSGSLAEEIANLKTLHDQGVLSDEEFNLAKAKLLGSS